MSVYDYLTPSGADILDNVDELLRAEMEFTLFDIAQKLEVSENTLDVVNFGNRVKPELWLSVGRTELGMVKTLEDGSIFVDMDENAKVKADLVKDVKHTLSALESREEAMDLLETNQESIMTRSQMAKDTIDKINQSLDSKGLKNPYEKQQRKFLAEMEKADKKDAKNFEAKSQYKETMKELNSLYKAMKEQLEIAKENGFSEKDAQYIGDMANNIAQKTAKAAKLKEEIPSIKDFTLKTVANKSTEIKNAVKTGFDKIRAGLDAKIQAGKNTLTSIKNEVVAANDRFNARTDTMYTGLTEKVEQISRDWKALTYSIDKNICNTMEKLKDTLEKSYDKQAEIKGAFKDLGRAFLGKQRTNEKSDYTPTQKECLNFLNTKISEVRQEMSDIKKEYDVSLAASVHNVKSAQEYRKGVGLDFSKSLDDNIKNAIARSQQMKDEKSAGKDTPKKETPQKDNAER